MTIHVDNDSPPGSWAEEMARMPWKYSQQVKIDEALAAIRKAGFMFEANLFAQEINILKAEIEHARNASR